MSNSMKNVYVFIRRTLIVIGYVYLFLLMFFGFSLDTYTTDTYGARAAAPLMCAVYMIGAVTSSTLFLVNRRDNSKNESYWLLTLMILFLGCVIKTALVAYL